ncbi:hypothetical protein LCL87_14450 [Rhodococcus hoagii]|nr:hypothetical protein [Prescottella equi]
MNREHQPFVDVAMRHHLGVGSAAEHLISMVGDADELPGSAVILSPRETCTVNSWLAGAGA